MVTYLVAEGSSAVGRFILWHETLWLDCC